MYEICIFDLYGTLVDIHTDQEKPELWEKLAMFYGYYQAKWKPEELRAAYERLTCSMTSGAKRLRSDSHEAFPEIQIEEVFRAMFTEKGIEPEQFLVTHAAQFFRALSTDYIRLYEGTEEMLRRLKEAGKKVYLLSNAQRVFTWYEMNALGITPYFDGIFISSDQGCKKPDIAFFRKLIDTYQIPVERAVMIGNDGICDIQGAKKAGLSTLYVHSNISPKEEMPAADHVLQHMDMKKITEILLGGRIQ